MQAVLAGAFTESRYYCEWMMGIHYSLEYYYTEMGWALTSEEADLEAKIKLSFKTAILEKDIVDCFKQLLQMLEAETREVFTKDLATFSRLLKLVEWLTDLQTRVVTKLAARDWEPSILACNEG